MSLLAELERRNRLDGDIARVRKNVRGWIRDGTDFVGPPPEELATVE